MQALRIAVALQLATVQAPRELPLAGIQRARAFDVESKSEHIAVGYQDGRVLLVAARDGGTVRELASAGAAVPWTLRFSPEGERLACVDHGEGLRILVVAGDAPVVTHRAFPEREHRQHSDSDALLSWSPTGAHVLVGDTNGDTSLWAASGEFVRRLMRSEPPGVPQAAWSADGDTLFVADGSRVRALRASDGEEVGAEVSPRSIECGATVVAFAMHPEGTQMVTGHDDGRVFTWDLTSGSRIQEDRFVDGTEYDPQDDVADLAYSPSGDRLACSTRYGSHVFLQDVASGETVWTSEFLGAHWMEVLTIAWDPRGESLWFAWECGDGMLYHRAPGGTLARPSGHAFVPRFGGDVAVTIASGDLVAFDLDGKRRWRRVERRYNERTAFEILDRRGE